MSRISRRRRRFRHWGVYFPDMSGLRAALIDMGQLTLCLDDLLRERGLLDAELVEKRETTQRPVPAITVREALEALESAYRVFSNAASVVQRLDQAIEACDLMWDAADLMDDSEGVRVWLQALDVCRRVAADEAPVRRAELAAARAVERAHTRG